LLAAIAGKVTKEKFSKLLRERILDPLGMKNTGSDDSKNVINKMVSGYLWTFKKYYRDPYIYMPNVGLSKNPKNIFKKNSSPLLF